LSRLVFLFDRFLDSFSCFFIHEGDYTYGQRSRRHGLSGVSKIVFFGENWGAGGGAFSCVELVIE